MDPSVACVIMAGGRGERLWPLVRADVPKVCVRVERHQTLLGLTLQRLGILARGENTLIVTGAHQARPIARILPQRFRRSLLLEPEPKNTAACIALAAGVLAHRDPSTIMVVLPADHWIHPTAAFRQSLQAAIEAAQARDELVMIGLRPTRVHSGLGHLCTAPSSRLRRGCRVLPLARFIEKPSVEAARRLTRRRTTYWNAGIFVGRVGTFVTLLHRWLPDHARRLLPLGGTVSRSTFARHAAIAYRPLRAVSFDFGVMVHVQEGQVVEGRFEWEDLGSWDSWVRMNQARGRVIAVGGRNVNAISPDGHVVVTAGLDDAIIVHTPDATLVCRTDAAQAVRDVVARLSRTPGCSRYL